jgi:lysyl-tRNA synthetase class 2
LRIRSYLRAQGLAEVSTPIRVEAPAIEPQIDVLPCAGKFLATSPEIEMKSLLAEGSGSIFQIAHAFRKGEVGERHREEFHLIEWYRVGEPEAQYLALRNDLEALVAEVDRLVDEIGLRRSQTAPSLPGAGHWDTLEFADLWGQSTGRALPIAVSELRESLQAVSGGQGRPLNPADAVDDEELEILDLWSELFSWWSDRYLDPWLSSASRNGRGLHLIAFPAPLCALARIDRDGAGRPFARRFESYAAGVELGNGYIELRHAGEQTHRFELVNALRARQGASTLPVSARFCESVGRLPACAGIAVGLERLLCAALGVQSLSSVLYDSRPV